MESLIIAVAAGGLALIFAAITSLRVLVADAGNQRMRDIGDAIREGAVAFLCREYLALVPFVVVVTGVLWVLIDWHTLDASVPKTAISYLAGTISSASAGFIGMPGRRAGQRKDGGRRHAGSGIRRCGWPSPVVPSWA